MADWREAAKLEAPSRGVVEFVLMNSKSQSARKKAGFLQGIDIVSPFRSYNRFSAPLLPNTLVLK
jgi:hypothetical protein